MRVRTPYLLQKQVLSLLLHGLDPVSQFPMLLVSGPIIGTTFSQIQHSFVPLPMHVSLTPPLPLSLLLAATIREQNSATSGVTRSSSSTSTGDAAGPEGSIRMGCTNCLEGSHIWLSTTRRKAQARWCQVCPRSRKLHAGKALCGKPQQREPCPGVRGGLLPPCALP